MTMQDTDTTRGKDRPDAGQRQDLKEMAHLSVASTDPSMLYSTAQPKTFAQVVRTETLIHVEARPRSYRGTYYHTYV